MTPWSFETTAIHGGFDRDPLTGSTAVPIYQTASFSYETAEELSDVFHGRKYGHVYSRISNPTVAALESRINALEGGIGAIALASGMAAIAATLETFCEAGDHIVASNGLFGGTLLLLKDVMARRGIATTFVDLDNIDGFSAAIQPSTKIVLAEVIGNPKLDIADLERLSALCHDRGLPLVLDNTMTTAYLLNAKKWGVDIIVNCMGKFIAGTGNTIGGIIVDTGRFDWRQSKSNLVVNAAKRFGKFAFIAATRRHVVSNTGACLAPLNAYLFMMGIESLALRMDRHCENAVALASYLSTTLGVEAVRYPGLSSHSQFYLVDRQFFGKGGALLTVRLGSKARAFSMLNALKLVSNAANLGDAKTLAIHVASTIYKDLNPLDQEAAGVYDDMIRISVGIESISDIIADFDQAIALVNQGELT